MLKMSEFEELIRLRNKGYKQEDIASMLGRSLSTIKRYLRSGKLPVYHREGRTRQDPLKGFAEEVEHLIRNGVGGRVPRCSDIYRTLVKEGYTGSCRSLERKTEELRKSLNNKEIYFEQEVNYGDVIEGDFTEFIVPFIWGKEKRHLWVMTMKKSLGCFAGSFINQTFESFAEGSVKGFNYFGGISKEYRLDNLKPVVKKLLRNGRQTTYKFNQLRAHYGFMPSFCRPGHGNDKGSVEALNRHLKDYLSYEIEAAGKTFRDDEEFEVYLGLKVKEYNESKGLKTAEERKYLRPLPEDDFPFFSTELAVVNKYGFIRAGTKRYSVPAEYRYREVEVRLYSRKIEIFYKGEKIKDHKRQTSSGNAKPVIDFRDHVEAMLKKPGAFTYYKHKEDFFPTDSFREVYVRHPDNKNYLRCLALCKRYSLIEVETALRIILEEGLMPEYSIVSELLEPSLEKAAYDPDNLKPLSPSLSGYDSLLISAFIN